MATITEQMLKAGKTQAGGWSRAQLQLLGVPWPPPKGWKKAALGKEVPDETANQFTQLRGVKVKSASGDEA